jgi:hypothetical protein
MVPADFPAPPCVVSTTVGVTVAMAIVGHVREPLIARMACAPRPASLSAKTRNVATTAVETVAGNVRRRPRFARTENVSMSVFPIAPGRFAEATDVTVVVVSVQRVRCAWKMESASAWETVTKKTVETTAAAARAGHATRPSRSVRTDFASVCPPVPRKSAGVMGVAAVVVSVRKATSVPRTGSAFASRIAQARSAAATAAPDCAASVLVARIALWPGSVFSLLVPEKSAGRMVAEAVAETAGSAITVSMERVRRIRCPALTTTRWTGMAAQKVT